jgi:hypothetical protein
LCQLSPFIKKHHFHLRATDDLFVMVIECTGPDTEKNATALLQDAGAIEINTQIAEAGWWLGAYDQTQKLYEDATVVAH